MSIVEVRKAGADLKRTYSLWWGRPADCWQALLYVPSQVMTMTINNKTAALDSICQTFWEIYWIIIYTDIWNLDEGYIALNIVQIIYLVQRKESAASVIITFCSRFPLKLSFSTLFHPWDSNRVKTWFCPEGSVFKTLQISAIHLSDFLFKLCFSIAFLWSREQNCVCRVVVAPPHR